MIRRDLETKNVSADFGDLVVCVVDVIRELGAEADADLAHFFRLFLIGEEADPAEDDDALDVQRPVVTLAVSFVHDAEGNLVAGLDRVELVSCFCAVEVDFAVCFVVPVADRQAVWIAVFSNYTEDAAVLPQYIGPEAKIRRAYITQGVEVEGAVTNSVLFTNARVGAGAKVIDSVLMPGAVVEEGATVIRALVADKVRIGKGATVGKKNSENILLVAEDVKGKEE